MLVAVVKNRPEIRSWGLPGRSWPLRAEDGGDHGGRCLPCWWSWCGWCGWAGVWFRVWVGAASAFWIRHPTRRGDC